MRKLLITTVAAAGLFFRLGRAWTKDGITVSQDEFSEDEWNILAAEPMLHIAPAPVSDAPEADPAEDALRSALREAIGKLEPGDFAEDGVPKAEVIRKLLPSSTKGVTKALVAEVWAELKPVA